MWNQSSNKKIKHVHDSLVGMGNVCFISLQPFMAASKPFQNSPHPIPVFVVEHGQPLKKLHLAIPGSFSSYSRQTVGPLLKG